MFTYQWCQLASMYVFIQIRMYVHVHCLFKVVIQTQTSSQKNSSVKLHAFKFFFFIKVETIAISVHLMVPQCYQHEKLTLVQFSSLRIAQSTKSYISNMCWSHSVWKKTVQVYWVSSQGMDSSKCSETLSPSFTFCHIPFYRLNTSN